MSLLCDNIHAEMLPCYLQTTTGPASDEIITVTLRFILEFEFSKHKSQIKPL